jgi:hypothetical protein
LTVTVANSAPSAVGGEEMVTVNWDELAEVTVPTTPRVLKTTLSLAVEVEKPAPLMRMVALLSAMLAVLEVTVSLLVKVNDVEVAPLADAVTV